LAEDRGKRGERREERREEREERREDVLPSLALFLPCSLLPLLSPSPLLRLFQLYQGEFDE
jgi:hypothetical protein